MENAGKENFELAMLDEYMVLYTGSRIDRNTALKIYSAMMCGMMMTVRGLPVR